jgi:hypothetical protein
MAGYKSLGTEWIALVYEKDVAKYEKWIIFSIT